MSGLLASVRNVEEALLAAQLGADLIDLKEPARGALGALDPEAAHRIVVALRRAGHVQPVSATLGDLPFVPGALLPAIESMASTGVDFVKLGVFANQSTGATIEALRGLAARNALIAVLFADRPAQDLATLAEAFIGAGFRGVMLDTAAKDGSSLTDHLPLAALSEFVSRARAQGALVGLAGSLRAQHIPLLLPLAPDYLGFRGALTGGARSAGLDAMAFRLVRGRFASPGSVRAGQPPMSRVTAEQDRVAYR